MKKECHVQTNEKKLQMEHKDIKDLEVIEKKEISAGKQVRFLIISLKIRIIKVLDLNPC